MQHTKTELALIGLFFLGLAAKLFSIPYSEFPIMLSMLSLSIIYLLFAFYFFSEKDFKTQELGVSIVGGFFLTTAPIGVLFYVLSWPGAQFMVYSALPSLVILLIVLIILRLVQKKGLENYYNIYLARTIFWLVACMIYFIL